MMGEHLFEFDTEAELIEAFESFDEGDTGFVKCDEIRRWLSEVGERMDQEEVRCLFLCAIYGFRMADLDASPRVAVEWLSLASCHYRSTSFSKVPSRIDKETSTTANGSKFYESMQRRAMVIHEPSNTAAYWTLLQSCICNLIAVLLAMTSRPHNFEFYFTFVKRDVKQI